VPRDFLGLNSRSIALPTGVELHYVEQGDPQGRVLIFLHGFTDSWQTWDLVLSHLSRSYRAYALTQRGHGDSDKPACCYRVADYVRDVLAFMDLQNITQATLIGHSMGSYIAAQVAADHPERIDRLVLIGWGPARPASPAAVERVIKLNTYIESLEDRIDPAFVRDFVTSSVVSALPQAYVERQVAESLKVPLFVWRQMLANRLDSEPEPPLGPIAARTLVLYGDHDVYVSEGQHRLMSIMPDATYIVYPATGHALHWDQPRRFVADVHAFLAEPESSE
jgi:non-heme chloroperoxidase